MSNLIILVLEILYFLIKSTAETIVFITTKTIELFSSLAMIAYGNILALATTSLVGGIIFYLALKYIFGLSKHLLVIMIIYGVIVAIIFVLRFAI